MSRSAQRPLSSRSRAVRCCAGLLATLLALPAPAAFGAAPRSPDARPLVVVDLSPDAKENAELLLALRVAVADHTNKRGERDYQVHDVNASLNAGGETRDRQNVATAQGISQAGKASFDAKDYRDAADQYESAKKLYEESLAVVDQPAVTYPAVLLALGESQTLSGDRKGALATFAEAAIWGADSDRLGATARALFEQATKDVAARPFGGVDIATDPSFAEVFVDGKFRGISPLATKDLRDLVVGPHLVTVSKAGYERVTSRIDLAKDKPLHRELKLPMARRKLLLDELKPKLGKELAAAESAGDPMEGKGGDAVAQLGTLFRAETVLVTRMEGPPAAKRLTLALFHVPTQRLVAHRVVEGLDATAGKSDALAAAVAATFDIDWVTALGGKENKGGKAASGSIVGKWWFWTIIGVAVAGGVTAAVLATQSSESPPPFAKAPGTGAMVLRF